MPDIEAIADRGDLHTEGPLYADHRGILLPNDLVTVIREFFVQPETPLGVLKTGDRVSEQTIAEALDQIHTRGHPGMGADQLEKLGYVYATLLPILHFPQYYRVLR